MQYAAMLSSSVVTQPRQRKLQQVPLTTYYYFYVLHCQNVALKSEISGMLCCYVKQSDLYLVLQTQRAKTAAH